MRVRIKEGWDNAGRLGAVLGEAVHTKQDWTPVLWDNEENPEFHKTAGLIFFEEKDEENSYLSLTWADLKLEAWSDERKMWCRVIELDADRKHAVLSTGAIRFSIDTDKLTFRIPNIMTQTFEQFDSHLRGWVAQYYGDLSKWGHIETQDWKKLSRELYTVLFK